MTQNSPSGPDLLMFLSTYDRHPEVWEAVPPEEQRRLFDAAVSAFRGQGKISEALAMKVADLTDNASYGSSE